jgi:signal transduction histidine kinase/streptogramin lyase
MFDARPITILWRDPHGQIWVGAKGMGIFRQEHDQFIPVTGNGVGDLLQDPRCLLMDKQENLWIGAGDDSVVCRTGDRWSILSIPHNLLKPRVSSLAAEADGTVWAGSSGGGLVQFKDGRPVAIPADSGLKGNAITALLADRDGKLWVGTESGLSHLRRKILSSFSQGEGLGFGPAQGLAEVAPGVIWVAKATDGLYRWDGRTFSRIPATGLSQHESPITGLLATRDGSCWVATTNSLLLYKDPVAAADEVKIMSPSKPWVTSLAEDNAGDLWLGTREGKLWELRENQWFEPPDFEQTNAITAIATAPDGAVWFGTAGNGVFRLAGGKVQRPGRRGELTAESVQTLLLDGEGTLWIGTASQGLKWWRNGRVFHLSSQDGLPDDDISQILEDDAGRLWVGSGRGIACIDKSRLDEFAAGQIPFVNPQIFGRTDGMFSEECTGGFCPAGLKTTTGLLWFSTRKGVVAVNPSALPPPAATPGVVLENILVDGVSDAAFQDADQPAATNGASGSPRMPEPVSITPGKHRVEFRYTSVDFDKADRLHFRYQLQGLDNDWVDAGTRRTASYPYLPAGNYRFRVAASASETGWAESELDVPLVVLRHFWQTWWFDSLVAMAGIMGVVGAVRVIEKRKHQRRLKLLEQERALERERSRIAHDLHDEMGAKLCRISFLSEHARRDDLPADELREQITSISLASRDVLHSLDEIVWAVNPQNDTLEHVGSYLGRYAEEYFQMTGIQCELDIPTPLPPYPLSSQMRHQLFLAAHEAITNILKHSGATWAGISLKFGPSEFALQIADNGRGFDPAGDQSKNGKTGGPSDDGDGLKNMRQRLADIGGKCFIEAVPGRGTKIRFVIPMKTQTQKP